MKGKGIHSKSIFVQLIVFSLLTSLVPILIISIFLFYKLDNTAQTETKDYHEQITSQYMKNVEEKLQQYRNSLEVIANNTVILNTLTDENLKSVRYEENWSAKRWTTLFCWRCRVK